MCEEWINLLWWLKWKKGLFGESWSEMEIYFSLHLSVSYSPQWSTWDEPVPVHFFLRERKRSLLNTSVTFHFQVDIFFKYFLEFFFIIKVPAKFRLHFRISFLSELATHQKNLLVWIYHPLVNTSLSGSFRDAQQCNAVYGITIVFRQYQILSPSNPSNIGMKRPYPKCWDKREDKPAASGQAWDCPWTILL